MTDFFSGRKCVIATMHQKQNILQPILESELGVECILPSDLNTDIFGTFTREKKRKGDMLQAARSKIMLAFEQTGCDLGVASEGSFGMHYGLPFMNSNFEIVLLYDKKNDFEVVGHFLSPNTNLHGEKIASREAGKIFAEKIGFPSHGIVLRLSEKLNFFIYKDFKNFDEFDQKMKQLFGIPFIKNLYIETDMRAHKNPTRMENIKEATHDLIKNIHKKCPQCNIPGFVVTDIERGLKCSECLSPTNIPKYEISICKKCHFIEKKKITQYGKYANVSECSICNP